MEALAMQDGERINAQAVVDAALEWKTQRVSILLTVRATRLC